jgi:hypothetical protein
MAKTQIVTDDLDGSPNAQTVRFSLEGRTYELDLAQKSRERLEKALQPFIDKASKVGAPARALRAVPTNAPRTSKVRRSRSELAQAAEDRIARQWALATRLKVNGKGVGLKGRLHPDVRAAWQRAGKPAPPE